MKGDAYCTTRVVVKKYSFLVKANSYSVENAHLVLVQFERVLVIQQKDSNRHSKDITGVKASKKIMLKIHWMTRGEGEKRKINMFVRINLFQFFRQAIDVDRPPTRKCKLDN